MSWRERLAKHPRRFAFHALLRRFEAGAAPSPRLGDAEEPSEEPVRLGQTPWLVFEGAEITAFVPGEGGRPPRVQVGFFGLWGPQGPMPSHITEYARDRQRNAGDPTIARFADTFHHRMVLLFHKAWARARPTVSLDRPHADAFARYVGAFVGLGASTVARRDEALRWTALFYAPLLASPARNPDGLRQLVSDHLGVLAKVEEFVGAWVEVPDADRWRLGRTASKLGATTLGHRVFERTQTFRLVLGPLPAAALAEFLPGGERLAEVRRLVQLYTNDEWAWELRLVASASSDWRMRLGRSSRLGWTTRLGDAAGGITLTVDPATGKSRRDARATPAD